MNDSSRPEADSSVSRVHVSGYGLDEEPYYLALGDEVELFQAAYEERLPVLLKGPTGCGKTRFVEYMAFHLYRGQASDQARRKLTQPLLTVACHEDLSATDLEIGLDYTISEVKVDQTGQAVLDAERLAAIVRESTGCCAFSGQIKSNDGRHDSRHES